MTRLIRYGFLLILAVAVGGVKVWAQPFPKDIQRIVDHKKIRVAIMATDYPPFLTTGAEGQPQGFDVRLAREIARELGVEVTFLRTAPSFDGVVQQVTDKKADLGMSLLSVTPHRARMVYFTDPYLTLHLALLVNRRQRLLEQKKFPHQVMKIPPLLSAWCRAAPMWQRAGKIFLKPA